MVNSAGVSSELLQLIVCPACHGGLAPEAVSLRCTGCGRKYPIVDGIPVLIAEPAKTTGLVGSDEENGDPFDSP